MENLANEIPHTNTTHMNFSSIIISFYSPARYWAEHHFHHHHDDDGGGKEDCAHFRNDEKKSWNDLPCSTSLKWICKKPPNNFMFF